MGPLHDGSLNEGGRVDPDRGGVVDRTGPCFFFLPMNGEEQEGVRNRFERKRQKKRKEIMALTESNELKHLPQVPWRWEENRYSNSTQGGHDSDSK